MVKSDSITSVDFSQIKKILIVRLGKIGDIIVTSFVFEVLKRQFPHLEIYLFTLDSNRDLLKYNPHLSRVFYTKKNITQYFKAINLRSENFDMILDFNDNPSNTSTFIFKFVTASIKAGYNFPKYDRCINIKINPLAKETYHIIERMNNFLIQLGIAADEKFVKPFFYVGNKELNEVEAELTPLKVDKQIVAINFSAGAKIRYWDVEKWKTLLHSINESHKNFIFLLLSSEEDQHSKREIAFSLGGKNCVEGKFSTIQHFAAYIKSAQVLITPDTSAVHVASSFSVPTLALYPNPDWNYISWQPYHVPHRSIKSSSENVSDISVEEVFTKFESLIKEIGLT